MGFYQQIMGTSGRVADVDLGGNLLISPSNTPAYTGSIRFMSLTDEGFLTGVARLQAPETDSDYRLRTSDDCLLDDEQFNYTAQNTGKHTILAAAVNFVPSWTAGGYNTNPTAVLTTTSGATLQTYACFNMVGTATLSVDMELAFTAQPQNNTIVDFGLFTGAASNPFAPTDGAYFRLNSAGLLGVVNYNGNETTVGPFPLSNGTGVWTYANSKKYQFILYCTTRDVEFWVSDPTNNQGACLLGLIPCPDAQGTPFMSTGQPFHIRQAISGGAAGAGLNTILSRYCVRVGGVTQTDTLALFGSRALGTYQGLSGGTLGSIISGTIATGTWVPPTPSTPSNTVGTAGTGLGGIVYEVPSGSGTDGILMNYQVPAGTVNVQGRRLKISSISISSYVVNGPMFNLGPGFAKRYYLAYGHTAVSLQTAESATAKAPRRVMLGISQGWAGTTNSGAGPLIQSMGQQVFVNPIYVNPGEFVALVTANIGLAGTGFPATCGTIGHSITYDYSWE